MIALETLLSEAKVVYNMLYLGRICLLAWLAVYQQVLKCQMIIAQGELMPCCTGSEMRQCLMSTAVQAASLSLHQEACCPLGNRQC